MPTVALAYLGHSTSGTQNNTANCHTKVPLGTVVPGTHLVDLTRRTHKISRVGRFYRGVGGFNVKKLNSLNLAYRCVLGVDSEGF